MDISRAIGDLVDRLKLKHIDYYQGGFDNFIKLLDMALEQKEFSSPYSALGRLNSWYYNKKVIRTAKSHPWHHTVGKQFRGTNWRNCESSTFYCDSYDPSCGYWMTDLFHPDYRHNVSEVAIGRVFHEINNDEYNGRIRYYCQWGPVKPEDYFSKEQIHDILQNNYPELLDQL